MLHFLIIFNSVLQEITIKRVLISIFILFLHILLLTVGTTILCNITRSEYIEERKQKKKSDGLKLILLFLIMSIGTISSYVAIYWTFKI